jgi:hypothetical protein
MSRFHGPLLSSTFFLLLFSTVEFGLSNLQVVFEDGICAGETLLHQLGITQCCRIVLDHLHLLSGGIGYHRRTMSLFPSLPTINRQRRHEKLEEWELTHCRWQYLNGFLCDRSHNNTTVVST